MDPARIAELLKPFLPNPSPALLEQLKVYLDLLLRWNARTNLTAVRDPEQIVARHFGESLFAARVLFGDEPPARNTTLADVGSGAGFPGIPIKLYAPGLRLTLIESQNKKATFLREAIRSLGLRDADLFGGRAEHWGQTADVVTLRAVEKSEQAVNVAANLVKPGGRLCLMAGAMQAKGVELTGGQFTWTENAIPNSMQRVVVVGIK